MTTSKTGQADQQDETSGTPNPPPQGVDVAAPAPTRSCTACGKQKPVTEFYLRYTDGRSTDRIWTCRDCKNTGPRNPTPARLLRTRAQNRAASELIERHRVEFEALLEEATEQVTAEAERLAAAGPSADDHGHAAGLPRLKPGPRRKGQDVTERLDVARCPHCVKHHDRGHACPRCGATPLTRAELLAAVRVMLDDGRDIVAISQALRIPMPLVGQLIDTALKAERAS